MVGQGRDGTLEIDDRRRPAVRRRRNVVRELPVVAPKPGQPFERDADGDRRKPRREGGVAAIGVRAAARRDPRLLHGVVELMLMPAKEAPHEHAKARRVAVMQRAKGRLAAIEKAADERFVWHGGRRPVEAHILSVARTAKKVTSL